MLQLFMSSEFRSFGLRSCTISWRFESVGGSWRPTRAAPSVGTSAGHVAFWTMLAVVGYPGHLLVKYDAATKVTSPPICRRTALNWRSALVLT